MSSGLSYEIIRACRKGNLLANVCGCNKVSLLNVDPEVMLNNRHSIIQHKSNLINNYRSLHKFLNNESLHHKNIIPFLKNGNLRSMTTKKIIFPKNMKSRNDLKFYPELTGLVRRLKVKKIYAENLNIYRRNIGTNESKANKIDKERESSEEIWQWGGCSDDINFGQRLNKYILSSFEDSKNFDGLINIHNERVGRKVLMTTLSIVCKCHGISGSCASKVCWEKLSEYRKIGDGLLEKYEGAIKIKKERYYGKTVADDTQRFLYNSLKRQNIRAVNFYLQDHFTIKETKKQLSKLSIGPSNGVIPQHYTIFRSVKSIPSIPIPPSKRDLIYLEESPDFCEKNDGVGIMGTQNRSCLYDNNSLNSCNLLCCGRGHYTKIIKVVNKNCNCKFKWCCKFECETCIEEQIVNFCM
ncbi:unnamed protein product [Gordionus sp. m RMFG-2023]